MLTEISKTVAPVLESPAFTTKTRNAFVLIMDTMKRETGEIFSYMPEGERKIILDACITWMDIGLVLGNSPQAIVDILLSIKAKVTEIES